MHTSSHDGGRVRRKRVRSRRRAGRAIRRRTRRDQWREVREAGWRFVALLVVWVAATLALAWVQRTDFLRGLMVGLMAMAFVVVVQAFLASGRTVHWGMGAEAERWTTEILRQLGRSWLVIDDISFAAGNVDHLVVGPSCIYAVESKFMNAADESRLAAAEAQASKAARRVHNLLRSKGLERQVVPVLVIWGRGRRRLAEPYVARGDVRLVDGGRSKDWLDRMRRSSDGDAADIQAYDVLADFVAARDAFDRRARRTRVRRLLSND